MAAPATLNGLEVLASARVPGHGEQWIVLVHSPTSYQPYVTGLHLAGDTGWVWGHYFGERAPAMEDFVARVGRGF